MTTRQKLIKKLDAKIARSALVRDGCRCQLNRCHEFKYGHIWLLDPHHVEPRGTTQTRWLEDNIITLCRACHGWAEGHRAEFDKWFRKHYRNRWRKIQRWKKKSGRMRDPQLQELLEKL